MIIKTRNLTKKVSSEEGELIILNDINLELEKEKSLAVVGPSGSARVGRRRSARVRPPTPRPPSGRARPRPADLGADESGLDSVHRRKSTTAGEDPRLLPGRRRPRTDHRPGTGPLQKYRENRGLYPRLGVNKNA